MTIFNGIRQRKQAIHHTESRSGCPLVLSCSSIVLTSKASFLKFFLYVLSHGTYQASKVLMVSSKRKALLLCHCRVVVLILIEFLYGGASRQVCVYSNMYMYVVCNHICLCRTQMNTTNRKSLCLLKYVLKCLKVFRLQTAILDLRFVNSVMFKIVLYIPTSPKLSLLGRQRDQLNILC